MRVLPLILFMAISVLAGEGGSLVGIVKHDGEPPAKAPRKVADLILKDCPKAADVDNGSLLVDPSTKGIKWAIIRVMDVKAGDIPKQDKPVQIDQKHCVYEPHAVVIPPGGTIEMLNPDGVPHTITLTPIEGINPGTSVMMFAADATKTVKPKHFAEPELIQLACVPHPWMKAFIAVHDPRFAAVTGTDGKFEIKKIPAGKYKVLVNHDLGEREKEVEIKDGSATDIGEILFKAKAK